MMYESVAGSSTLFTCSCSSSGRCGTSSTMRLKTFCRLRASAAISGESPRWSGNASTAASRKGRSLVYGPMRTRSMPCTRIRIVPSGIRTMRCTTAAVPI